MSLGCLPTFRTLSVSITLPLPEPGISTGDLKREVNEDFDFEQ